MNQSFTCLNIPPNVIFYRYCTDKKAQNMTHSLHPAAQTGFSSAAELYQSVRPNYPQELVNWLAEDYCSIKNPPQLTSVQALENS